MADKVRFLEEAATAGYSVVLYFVGISAWKISEQRVAMRVSQGGHDVPSEKLAARFPRTLANLKAAIQKLPLVLVFDNEDIGSSYRKVAEFAQSVRTFSAPPEPAWLKLAH